MYSSIAGYPTGSGGSTATGANIYSSIAGIGLSSGSATGYSAADGIAVIVSSIQTTSSFQTTSSLQITSSIESSSFASSSVSSSYALFAETASYSGHIEKGAISGSEFGGAPLTSSVAFDVAFGSDVYTVYIAGEDFRGWTVESRTTDGFVINSNANIALSGVVFWRAEAI